MLLGALLTLSTRLSPFPTLFLLHMIWFQEKHPKISFSNENKQMLPIILKPMIWNLNTISVTIASSNYYRTIIDPGVFTGKERIWGKNSHVCSPSCHNNSFTHEKCIPSFPLSNYVNIEWFKIPSLK